MDLHISGLSAPSGAATPEAIVYIFSRLPEIILVGYQKVINIL